MAPSASKVRVAPRCEGDAAQPAETSGTLSLGISARRGSRHRAVERMRMRFREAQRECVERYREEGWRREQERALELRREVPPRARRGGPACTISLRDLTAREERQAGWDSLWYRFQQVWVLDPRSVSFVAWWDVITTLALIWTALVTPVEVAFVHQPSGDRKWVNSLFIINRLIDVLFISDMLLQFRLAYKEENVHGTRWIVDAKHIAVHYAFSFWFPLDVFSVMTSLFDIVEVDGAGDLTVLRAVRTLRLVKLVKLARGSRIFKRWEMRISIDYTYFSLFTVVTSILLTCHWTACIWGLQATFDPLHSWQGATGYCVPLYPDMNGSWSCPDGLDCHVPSCSSTAQFCDGGYACVDGYQIYIYSLYWSILTITSVGYGDIVATPFNTAEQIVCSIVMLLSGMLWGYLVGVFCSLAAASPSIQAFQNELSELNKFMASHNLSSDLRFRLREFIHETVHLRNAEARNVLISKLSPAMQGEVSLLVNQRWLCKVWYLERGMQLELLIEIASRLKAQVFAPWEFCPAGAMYILHRGTVLWAGRPRAPGSAWGDDVLLSNKDLHLTFSAIAITYLWVFTIDGAQLHAAIRKFPKSAPKLYLIARQWTLRRALVRLAERKCIAEGKCFRGRLYPIYAKEFAQKTLQRRVAADARRRPSKTGLATTSSRLFKRHNSFKHTQREDVKNTVKKGRWNFISRLPDTMKACAERSILRNRSMRDLADEETSAAANFGLHLREEQLHANDRVDDRKLVRELSDDVKQLKDNMIEVLALLRAKGGSDVSALSSARSLFESSGRTLPSLKEEIK
ncbi:hypothetical protein AB1Y20_002520 [Prymnesium parvum]|uniref:Ion transport domain-containing protein n=1 Tax=Prymnesium parvum TaxID=97485 RepID=A0AB34J9J5_PRYPA